MCKALAGFLFDSKDHLIRIGDLQAALDEYCMLAKKYLDADIVVAGILVKDDPAVEFDY